MAFPTAVNGQITDAVTQANVKVTGEARPWRWATSIRRSPTMSRRQNRRPTFRHRAR
ncbi:hypothetical protein C0V82_00010 [Niveispirillum cyanobacteriorum]|uniref:Uncharacterized protein n=1 Tax=Niveispirillum cyanobacteriorum TaxID=1612173 RepID=A0A2K9N6R5_9PROT|nr:hypothetical protein C0V82_00010 [Niveispirillum cyanobacteriorum]